MSETAAAPTKEPEFNPQFQEIIAQLLQVGNVIIDIPPKQYGITLGTNLRLAVLKKRENQHGLVGWMRKHNRMLTIVGALLLLVTFIAKDIIQEELKDLVGSITETVQIHDIREDLANIVGQLQDLQLQMFKGSNNQAVVSFAQMSLDSSWSTIARSTQLNSVLKKVDQNKFGIDLKSLENDLISFSEDFKKFTTGVQGAPSTSAIVLRASTLSQKAINLEAAMISKASSKRTVDEQFSAFTTYLSYLLYVMGWSLALVGRLFGVDLGTGE